MAQKFQPGDNVEFEDPSIARVCRVVDYLPEDENGKSAYVISCHYVVSEDDVTLVVEEDVAVVTKEED